MKTKIYLLSVLVSFGLFLSSSGLGAAPKGDGDYLPACVVVPVLIKAKFAFQSELNELVPLPLLLQGYYVSGNTTIETLSLGSYFVTAKMGARTCTAIITIENP